LAVQLEEPLKSFSEHITLKPLRVAGAAKEISEVGAAAAAGIRLKTADLAGVREVPVRTLQARTNVTASTASDELLGFKSEQPDWKLTLATERLSARIVAEVLLGVINADPGHYLNVDPNWRPLTVVLGGSSEPRRIDSLRRFVAFAKNRHPL